VRTGALQLGIESSRRFVQEVGFVCLAEWVVGVLCVSFTSGEFGARGGGQIVWSGVHSMNVFYQHCKMVSLLSSSQSVVRLLN
jgi:hypothetical protein